MAGILGFVFRNDLVDVAARQGTTAIEEYREEDDDDFQQDVNSIVDFLQTRVSYVPAACVTILIIGMQLPV